MAQYRRFATQHERRAQARELPEPADGRVVPPSRRPPLLYNRTIDKFLVLLLPMAWFAYYSWKPVYQLRAHMPIQFVDAPASAGAADRAREQRLAQAYWDLARRVFRPRYTYGSPLPEDPPADFRLSPSGGGATGVGTAPDVTRAQTTESRLRYWHKFQQVWLEPYAWETKRQWSTSWFTSPFLRLYVNFQDYLSNRFKAI